MRGAIGGGLLLTIGLATTTSAAPAPKDRPPAAGGLVGEWVVESATFSGMPFEMYKGDRWVFFADGRHERTGSTGRVYSCRFVADPAKTPATLDLVPKDGKYPSPCIYKVAGDTLTIHYAVPAAERPTTFEPVVESKCILYVLKRVPPEKAKKGDPAQAEAERVADEALAKAKLFKDDENQEYYVKKLKDIVSNHPGTAAAREAQKLLNGPK
jgi:uncharacterized protein (TIGR03067 family)